MHSETSINFRAELNHFLIILGFLTFFFLSLICVVALILSHRAAGPICRFKIIFDKIAEGNLDERINLRPKDDLKEIALSFNKMMDNVIKKNESNK